MANLLMKTPPLSECDFTTSSSVGSEDLPNATVNDLQYYGGTRTIGTIALPDGSGVKLTNLTPDLILLDDETGEFKALSNGAAQVIISAPYVSKAFTFNVSYSSGSPVEFAPGTLGQAQRDFISGLVDGKTPSAQTQRLLTNLDGELVYTHSSDESINMQDSVGAYKWNPDCWAYPVDLTCMAVWRSGVFDPNNATKHYLWPVTAISPLHIACGHVSTAVGEKYHWITRDNTVIERTVVDFSAIPDAGPYYVAILDSPLPHNITPAWLMPENTKKFIPGYSNYHIPIPAIATNQLKEAIANCGLRGGVVSMSTNPFASWTKEIIGGDSSSPVYTVVNGHTVLLTSWYYGGYGNGRDYSQYITQINALMASLQQRWSIMSTPGDPDPYQAKVVDLSNYPSWT